MDKAIILAAIEEIEKKIREIKEELAKPETPPAV